MAALHSQPQSPQNAGELRFETLPYEVCADEARAFRNAQRGTARDEHYFTWRYSRKPAAGGAFVTFGRDGLGKAIAAASAIAHDFHFVDRAVRVAITGDIAVDPAFRGQGVARALLMELRRAALDRGLAGCFVLPNADVTGSLIKAGWAQVSAISRYIRPLSIKRHAGRRFGTPGRLIGSVVDALAGFGSRQAAQRVTRDFDFAESPSVDDRYDDLWARLPRESQVLAVRNCAYLRWRFIDKPGADYAFLEASKGGRLAGYVVYRLVEETAQIEDFIAIDEATSGALAAQFITLIRTGGRTDTVQARFVADTRCYVPWRSRGFVRRADSQLVLWAGAPGSPPAPPSQGWFVTPADKDV